jgi:hypothetical protein
MGERNEGERRLAGAVADYLAAHGYRVSRGVSMRGRSGARHDIDVLAERSDDVTSYRLMVQCSGANAPIDDDVVAGAHLAMVDTGMSKVIVVSTRAWRFDVKAQAGRLGVDLWGPEEIEERLGSIPHLELAETGDAATVGLPVNTTQESAAQLMRRETRGTLGIGREAIQWIRPFWLPFHRIRTRHTREEKERFHHPHLRAREYWNVYDGLEGSLAAQWDGEPRLVPTAGGTLVRPRVPDLAIMRNIEEIARGLSEAATPEDRERQEEALRALGIPLPVTFFELSQGGDVYMPFFLALVRSRDGDRVVAVDAHEQDVSEPMSRIAMKHLGHILGAGGEGDKGGNGPRLAPEPTG